MACSSPHLAGRLAISPAEPVIRAPRVRLRDGHSVSEISEPGSSQPLNEGKDHRRRNAEHEHSVCCFQGAQQSPRRRHDDVSVTQCRKVDR